jgi:hypothetical protein
VRVGEGQEQPDERRALGGLCDSDQLLELVDEQEDAGAVGRQVAPEGPADLLGVAAAGPPFEGAAVGQGEAQALGGLADGLGQSQERAGAGLDLDDMLNGLGRALTHGLGEGAAAPAGEEPGAGERGLTGAAVAGNHDEGLAAQELEKGFGLRLPVSEQVRPPRRCLMKRADGQGMKK